MIDNKYIAVIDSGVGGLHILQSLVKDYPDENFLFLADEAYFPYGIKTKEQLVERLTKITKALEKLNIKAIVIACNTASSVASYLEKITDIPIIEIIGITSLYAIESSINKKIGLWATNATINSYCYQTFLEKEVKCYPISASDLVEFIENDQINSKECLNNIKQHLIDISDSDSLILGCTHFPLLSDVIKIYNPNLKLISSNIPVKNKLDELMACGKVGKANLVKRNIVLYSTSKGITLKEKSLRFELPDVSFAFLELN